MNFGLVSSLSFWKAVIGFGSASVCLTCELGDYKSLSATKSRPCFQCYPYESLRASLSLQADCQGRYGPYIFL